MFLAAPYQEGARFFCSPGLDAGLKDGSGSKGSGMATKNLQGQKLAGKFSMDKHKEKQQEEEIQTSRGVEEPHAPE